MNLTTELRLKDKAGCDYLDNLLEEENKIFMSCFKEMKSPSFRKNWVSTSELNSYLCKHFGILSRHANSVIYRVRALLDGYRENKKWEITDKIARLQSLEDLLEKKVARQRKLKKKAGENLLNEIELGRLRNLNSSLYHLKNRINKLRQKIKSLKKDLKNGKFRIGIGSKRLFKKQFNLEAAGFKDHNEWKKAFTDKKSHMLYYIGRGAETGGNQMASLFINKENGSLSLRLRKEHEKKAKEKYLWFDNLNLSYLKDEVYAILRSPRSQPVTIRLLKRDDKWYLQIMFEWREPPVVTDTKKGVIAIDVNHAFLQQGELDDKANLVNLNKRRLKFHGSGTAALCEIRQQVRQIVDEAGLKGKSIAIEDLDFQLKKARVKRKGSIKNRKYNKMVSTLDYKRFREEITRCGTKAGVEIIAVPAYNTSKIAAEKYCPGRCLSVHQGSTITIGRRAMGFSD